MWCPSIRDASKNHMTGNLSASSLKPAPDPKTTQRPRTRKRSIMMSTQIPRPTANATSSSNSTDSSTPFAGNMDTYTLSMYEHTKRLMAAAQIPYGSPASLTLSRNEPAPAAGTSSGGVGSTLTSPKSGGLSQLRSS
ncbi:hypothetical protein LX36DRAFT_109371 [Colletotrichum falcatum]|nr:hypothetical protein LX36DRAFT_109371 [Colletotrichum falcatum]